MRDLVKLQVMQSAGESNMIVAYNLTQGPIDRVVKTRVFVGIERRINPHMRVRA